MNPIARGLPCLLLFACAQAASAQATSSGTEPTPAAPADARIEAETVRERFHVDIHVAADGSSVADIDQLTRFTSDNAARSGSHVLLGYEPAYGRVEIVEAFTLKPDGSRIPVPKESMQTQVGRAALGAFTDAKTLQIEFPQVESGGGIALRYREVETKSRFPGQFTYWHWFSDNQLWRDVQIAVDAPLAYPLRFASRGGTESDTRDAERRRWRWAWRSVGDTLERPEASGIFAADYLPGVMVSSFADYAQLAAIYRGMIAERIAVTPKVQALADQLTAGVDDPGEQVRRLFDWVRVNVRYVQLYLGDGGWVPHGVDAILAAHFGDCKDHAALLGALLAAKGIASTPVLIGAERDYTLPAVPQPFVFNHIITWVPLLGRYLDSTARYSSLAVLPSADRGVPVLHVADGSVHITPTLDTAHDRSDVDTTLDIAADGSAHGRVHVLAQGADSIALRSSFESLSAGQRADFVNTLLLSRGLLGDGEFTIDTGLPADQYAVTMRVDIRNLANPEDAGALQLDPLLRGPRRLFDGAAFGQRYKTRRLPFSCLHAALAERYTLRFPSGWTVDLPAAVTAEEAGMRYRSDYRREDGAVVVERAYEATPAAEICTAADYPTVQRVSARVLADLRKQLVYRSAAVH